MIALVTGASAGIGKEFAELLAAEGYDLILVSRRQAVLDEVKKILEAKYNNKIIAQAYDLTDPQAPRRLFDDIQRQGLTVDVLINNAGFGLHGPFYETDCATEKNMIQLNIIALSLLCKLFLQSMRKRNKGAIINVASTAAFAPGPFMSVYYATKAYVLSFSEALYEELKGSGIKIIALCPGPTETNFSTIARLNNARVFKSGLIKIQNPVQVARLGMKALKTGKPVAVSGFMNKLTPFALRFTPRFITRGFMAWLNSQR